MRKLFIFLLILMMSGCSINLPNVEANEEHGEYELIEYQSVAVIKQNSDETTLYLYLSNYNLFKLLANYHYYDLKNNASLKLAINDSFEFENESIDAFVELCDLKISDDEYNSLLDVANEDLKAILKIEIDTSNNQSISYENWDNMKYEMINDSEYNSDYEYLDN